MTNLNDAGMDSLRQAILDTPSGGTVDFQPGMTGTITLTTGELGLSKSVTIAGRGSGVLSVSGNSASRVFEVLSGANDSISGLTITGGTVTGLSNGGCAGGQRRHVDGDR